MNREGLTRIEGRDYDAEMTFGKKQVVLVFCSMIFPASALGWSSKSSRTENEVFTVKNAILIYYVEHREYPDPTSLFEDLVGSRVWFPRKEEKRIVDSWGHELMVRIPGTHEEVDIHSVGPDGIDQSGAGDDISSWSGVNEGYHYKRTWPLGRALLMNHSICGLVFLAAAWWMKWPVVLSISGMITSSGVMLGCHLLQHPGLVPDRNGPLVAAAFFAGVVLVVSAISLILFCRRESAFRSLETRDA